MSYSFTVKAATKAAARAAAEAEFDKMVLTQSIHARDKPAAMANLDAVLGLVQENPDRDVNVSMNGYVTWSGSALDTSTPLLGACVSASAFQIDRTA